MIKALNQRKRHSSHHFELSWVDDSNFGISSGKCDNGACQVQLVHIKKTLFLNAEIGKEFSIAPQIFRVLLRYLT
jgi:hypothetical protein